ncbi:hypothetical protein DEM27_22195 [Metarhizobium album]|uniref:Uncharacterized protein n=1 Tax=Metarhizobium album TaxID=2182425 RepID=A0A2U2DL55_9HYPH|nr:hypothetical protein [Rhizobium album]PWE54032.1 hypothetical protein DEM27_22195 [Rhizobium album]
MPEGYRKLAMHPAVRAKAFTLAHAHESNLYVRVHCKWCRISRLYYAKDILRLCGDVLIDEVPPQMRCEKCRRKDHLDAQYDTVYGPDVGKTKIRRLVEIKTIRRPIWIDEII